MKVLGKNSLSSKVLIGLKMLFVICMCIFLYLGFIIAKDVRNVVNDVSQPEITEFILTIGIFITLILFFIMLWYLIKFFNNLKNSICFDESNVRYLSKIMLTIFIASIVYFIISILETMFYNQILSILAINIFLWILTIIIFCTSVGLKIFIEIYKKAIEFKNENDFTI